MGSWDELCLLCGICPSGGPDALLHRSDLDRLAEQITEEVKPNITSVSDDELLSIVKDALASSFSDDDRKLDYRPPWLPVGLGQNADLTESTCVAIGYFDEEEEGGAPVRDGKIPDGRHVDVRRVRGFVGGDFRIVLRTIVRSVDEEQEDEEDEEDEEGREDEGWVEEVEHYRDSACCARSPEIPNFWLCERCYNHLNAWLEVESLPTRSGTISLAGELYEIVNSRAQRRTDPPETGLLPWINYEGIEETLQQSQRFFSPARLNSQNMMKGICAGLRGADLIPDIMRDFRCWMFMQPDIWPEPSSSPSLIFATYNITPMRPVPVIATLPVELLILISHELPVQALLALSSTCKSLRALITDASFLSVVLSDALLHGNLRYILPITPGETSKADDVAEQWLRKVGIPSSPDGDVMNFAIPFAHPKFPYAEFIRACFESDSMRNRERIWGLVQQFRHSWKQYRREGWEVDRFYSSDDLPASFKISPNLLSA